MEQSQGTATKEYIAVIEAMEQLFDFWNGKYFENALEKPVITVCQDRRGRAYGWFVPSRIWKKTAQQADSKEEGYPEINMCSQYLNRPFRETAQTMLHEMCHLYAFSHEIADTSTSGRYHNREYKKIAETHGLLVSKSKYHGYSVTELTEESKALLSEFEGEKTFLFDIRPRASKEDFIGAAEKKAKVKRPPVAKYIYTCPKCGQKVKGYKKAPTLLCAVCNVPFESE